MINFTLKNIPANIHKYLKKEAKSHHRSLNSEIIAKLEEAIGKRNVNADVMLSDIRAIRSQVSGKMTDAKLIKYKNTGRL